MRVVEVPRVSTWQTTTNSSGYFSYRPEGLVPGQVTIRARARELDSVTKQWVVGDWEPFTLTYDRANQPPEIVAVELELATDFADSGGAGPWSTDPTLQGRVTNDGPVDAIMVEFDLDIANNDNVDFDDVVDGTAITDADGRFFLSPAGLEPGSITVRVRAKEYGENGAALYSHADWATCPSYTFELRPWSYEVTTLELDTDPGGSSDPDDDGVTTSPLIQGSVSGPVADLSGITIELDVDGDGEADGNVQSGGDSGGFSYTPDPADLEEGLVTVGVRVVADQDGWPQYGSWTSVAFVYYQDDGAEDPFGLTEALALAADLAVDDPADPDDPGDPNWRDPDATYTAASYAVQTTYRTDLAAHTLAYDTTVADATWLRNTQVQTATDTYNSLVATAEAAYTAAVTQAGSDFQDALQQLPAEQRTSYHVQEFAWAAAPYDNAPTLPDPSTQPLPPGAAPAYDGFSFDFTSDPYHREAMAMAAASYTATIRQSDTALAAARQEAKAALDAALAAAQATYGQKQAEIRQQYETDIQAGTPPYDLTVARAAYRDAVQAAYNAYMAVYAVQYGLLQNADVTASTQRACLEALATALNARDKAISSAEEDFANRQAAVIRWQQQRQIEAEQDRDLALAQAERDRAMAEAAARRIHAETLAGATETRAQQAADAQEQRWQDEIDSKESRVDAFASATENLGEQGSSSEAARAEYQSDVVDHQQTYWGNVISAHSTYADAVAAALRTEAEAVAAAAEKHAQEAADAQYDRTTARAEATCDRELAEITAEWDLADENAQHRRTQQDAFADAQRDYDFDEAQRMETDTLKRLALATRWLAITQMEEGHAKNVAQRDFCIDEFTHDRTDVAQREQNEKNLQTARNNAAKAYRDDCLASEETWFGTIADAAAAYEIALAQIDRGYTVAVVASAGDRDNAIAAAAATRVQQVAGLEKQYLHDKAQQQVGRDNNEASAYHGYVSDLADDYLQEVTAWSDGSPWGVYQVALVTASKDRAVSLALSHVTYTSDVGIASTAWNDSVTTADETFTNAVAGADKARTADFVHALKRHTSRVAAARVVHAVTAANLTSQHDKDVAAKDRAYREGESVGGVVTGGVFNLDTSRLNDMAEAEREYEAGVQPEDPTFGDIEVYWIRYRRDEEEITPSEANEQTATHWVQVEEYNEQLRQTWHQEQADIYQQWANDQAADRQQWTNEVGQLNVDWTGAIAAADSALAAEIRRQDVQLANDRAGAAVAYAQAVAAASKAQTLGWAAADQTLTTSVAAADAADAVRWTAAENAAREQVAGAFGTYELALYTNHATALQSTGDPLADYIDEVADAYIAWAQAVKADRDTYHDDLTLANEALTAGLNSANTNHTSSVATANSQYTGGLAEAGRGWSIDSAKASAYLDRDSRAADANLVEARVNAQGAYDFARAVADRGLDDAKAAADVAWTAAVADQYAWLHLHPDADWPYGYPLPSAIVDANIAVADAAREALHDTAAYPHATKIRDAQIANAVRVGNAEVLRAAALGAVETTYVGRVNAAELDFANGVKAAEDVRAPLVANANILHANTTATVYEGYTNQLGGADVTYQGDLGDAYVTLAGTVAGHQADYHIALATAARDQHTQGTFPWDHADARLSWLTSLKPDYEAFVEDSAGSDADYDDGVAGAVAQWLDRLAHADVLYTDVAAPVDANYVRDVVQEGPAYQVDVVGRENSRRASLAAADQTQHADDAAARRTELVARITAQAEYEVDRVRITPVLGGVPLEEHPYMIAAAATRDATLDQAALALATQRADIDQVWTNGVAAANRDFIEGNAQDGKQLADGLASLEKSYRETLAGHVAAWKNDYADATAGSYSQQEGFGYLKALMVAENQWQADASAASAEWLQAGYDQTAAQWAGLAADYPTLPWAGFQADLSDTLANWWWDPQAGPEGEGFKQDYLEWVENTNASWDGYQDAANAAYVTQTAELAGSAQRLICGWTTGITGLAAADQTRANAVAQAYADYVGLPGGAHGMADAMEDYAQGVAQIHRDDAVAQKIEQLEGTPAPEIEPALAVEAAAYRGDAAALTIVGRNAVAAAALDYANTVYAAGGPFVTFHQESHAAVKTFLDAETDAFADTRIAIAGWDTTADAPGADMGIWQNQATSVAGTVAALAGGYNAGDPKLVWANQAVGQTAAQQDRVVGTASLTGLAEAQGRRVTSVAEADRQLELTRAAADELFGNAAAGSQASAALGGAAAAHDAALQRSAVDAALSAAGVLHAELPDMPEPADHGDGPEFYITPTDYDDWVGDAAYGLIFCAAAVDTSTTVAGPQPQTEAYLGEAAVRPELEDPGQISDQSGIAGLSWEGLLAIGRAITTAAIDEFLNATSIGQWVTAAAALGSATADYISALAVVGSSAGSSAAGAEATEETADSYGLPDSTESTPAGEQVCFAAGQAILLAAAPSAQLRDTRRARLRRQAGDMRSLYPNSPELVEQRHHYEGGLHEANRGMHSATDGIATFGRKFIVDSYRGAYEAGKETVVNGVAVLDALEKDPWGTVVNAGRNTFVAICTVDMWAPGGAAHAGQVMAGSDNSAKMKIATTVYLAVFFDWKKLANIKQLFGKVHKVGKVIKSDVIPGEIGKALQKGENLTLAEAKAAIRADGYALVKENGIMRPERAAALGDDAVDQLARQLQDLARSTAPSASTRLIPGQPGVVTGGSSTTLGKNMMESMGLARSQHWTGYQAQHIIPLEVASHPVLRRIGMNLDDASNGIFLRVPDDGISGMARHRGYHSTYNTVVERALNRMDVNTGASQLQQEVFNLQQKLRHLQQQGTPLYPSQGATVELWERLLGQ